MSRVSLTLFILSGRYWHFLCFSIYDKFFFFFLMCHGQLRRIHSPYHCGARVDRYPHDLYLQPHDPNPNSINYVVYIFCLISYFCLLDLSYNERDILKFSFTHVSLSPCKFCSCFMKMIDLLFMHKYSCLVSSLRILVFSIEKYPSLSCHSFGTWIICLVLAELPCSFSISICLV